MASTEYTARRPLHGPVLAYVQLRVAEYRAYADGLVSCQNIGGPEHCIKQFHSGNDAQRYVEAIARLAGKRATVSEL